MRKKEEKEKIKKLKIFMFFSEKELTTSFSEGIIVIRRIKKEKISKKEKIKKKHVIKRKIFS